MSIWSEAAAVVPAILLGDPWKMKDAFYVDGMWLFCVLVTLIGGYVAHLLFMKVPFIERHLDAVSPLLPIY